MQRKRINSVSFVPLFFGKEINGYCLRLQKRTQINMDSFKYRVTTDDIPTLKFIQKTRVKRKCCVSFKRKFNPTFEILLTRFFSFTFFHFFFFVNRDLKLRKESMTLSYFIKFQPSRYFISIHLHISSFSFFVSRQFVNRFRDIIRRCKLENSSVSCQREARFSIAGGKINCSIRLEHDFVRDKEPVLSGEHAGCFSNISLPVPRSNVEDPREEAIAIN